MNHIKRYFLTLILFVFLFSADVYAKQPPASFANLAEKLIPAVVNISSKQTIKSPIGNDLKLQPLPPGHPFEQFNELFKKFGGPKLGNRKATSLGSGFIISADGYLVTNNHVIDKADEIMVTLDDDSQYEASVVGRDPKTDLALLKIEAEKPLPFVNFGNSDNSRVGDWIIVIGNPFGLGGTVTSGIISARARDINAGPFDDFIQTDAAINRGNSGGPMFNLNGEVIGINTAIFSPNGIGNVGIGFAVPSSLAAPIINQLQETGKIQRGWLGVRIQTVTEEIAENLGLKEEKGALVAEVIKDSPAEKGGVKAGDVILKFDGKEITTMKKLPRIVAETDVEKDVDVEIWRNGELIVKAIVVAELEETEESEEEEIGEEEVEENNEILGMILSPLSSELKKKYKIEEDVEGLFLHNTEIGSISQERGLSKGDIILEANQKKVTAIKDIYNAIDEAKKRNRKSILLLIQRSGDTIFIALPINEATD